MPGLTNRLFGPLVDEVWLNAPESAEALGKKAVLTGTPVRASMLRPLAAAEARLALGLDPRKTTVVVMGGSQGARSLNEAVATLVTGRELPADWQILHVSGARDHDWIAERERGALSAGAVHLVEYLEDPRTAYAAADLVVTRSGASTLGELAATRTPALLVPFPFATADHQARNAAAFARGGAASVVADRELDADRLFRELEALLQPERLGAMRDAARCGGYGPAGRGARTGEALAACEKPTSVKLSGAVHFVGIGGIGMSALARILLQRGFRVSGSSDRRTPLTQQLADEGARIAIGHAAGNLGDAKTVVVSSAIDPENPELVAARNGALEIVHRGAMLAHLMHRRRGLAIAGTHGKTTTTAMTACVLEAAGLDPAVVVGGERGDTGSNARDGKGAWFVTESDESDGSFLELRPEIAVVTNVENDHVATDGELPAWSRLSRSF